MIGIESYPLSRYLIDQARGRRRDHQVFVYQGTVTFSAVGQVRTMAINVDSDAPFLWIKLAGQAFFPFPTNDARQQFKQAPDVRIMVRYGGAGGQSWAQTPVHWNNCVAFRPVPYVLAVPKLIDAGGQINAQLTYDSSPEAIQDLQINLDFSGTKLFRWRRA